MKLFLYGIGTDTIITAIASFIKGLVDGFDSLNVAPAVLWSLGGDNYWDSMDRWQVR